MRPTALLPAIVLAAAACGAPADIEVTAAGDTTSDSPTASESTSSSDDTLDDAAADGVIGQDLADRAEPDQFHPAMLIGHGLYAWYMNEPGWTDRIPDARVEPMCSWADDQKDDEPDQPIPGDLSVALAEVATEYRDNDAGPGDGLDNVIDTVCAGKAVPSAWARHAEEGQLGHPDHGCEGFADPKLTDVTSKKAVALCLRHQEQLSAASSSDT